MRADRAQREQIVEGQRQIAGGDEQPAIMRVRQSVASSASISSSDVDIAQDMIEHDNRDRDDGRLSTKPIRLQPILLLR